jgi:hypothetical protein
MDKRVVKNYKQPTKELLSKSICKLCFRIDY